MVFLNAENSQYNRPLFDFTGQQIIELDLLPG